GSKTYGVYYGASCGGQNTLKLDATLAKNNISADQYKTTLATEQKKLGYFYLFGGTPGDVYAIRVYDKVLTENVREYNQLIDLLAYYEVEIPERVTDAQLMSIAGSYYTTSFVYDTTYSGYTTAKNALTISVQQLVLEKTIYDELYVAQENLVGLYTAFGQDDSVMLAQAAWLNKAGANNASLYDNTDVVDWHSAGALGGLTLGIDSYNKWKDTKVTGAGIRLNQSWAELPSFTVETSSVAVGAYMPSDKTQNGVLVDHISGPTMTTDDGPKFEETFCLDMISSAAYFNLYSNNGLGMGFISRMEGVCSSAWWTSGGRSDAYRDLKLGVNPGSNTNNFGEIHAGLTLGYTKSTADDESVTFTMYFSNRTSEKDYVNIDAGSNQKGVKFYTYTKDDYASAVSKATITNGHKFSLYNRGMYDVYSIRVYNKVLNEEERAINHLVDLLAFYQIDIANLRHEDMALIAADYLSMIFLPDDKGYAKTKAELQSAVDRLVTIQVGDASETHYVPKAGYTLPETIKGMTLFGYEIGGASYAPGKVVTSAATVKALAVDEIKISSTVDAAVLSGKTGKGESYENLVAVRFNAEINKQQFLAMNALAGGGSINIVELGILIVPLSYVEQAAGDDMTLAEAFNMETLLSWYATHENPSAREHTGAYLDVNATDGYWRAGTEEGSEFLILSGGFGNFSESTLANDPLFAAVAYFEVEYKDADGKSIGSGVIYGAFEEEKCIKVSEVLSLAKQNLVSNSVQYDIMSGAVHRFEEMQAEKGAEAN
ncbi:MAG: hypothetical protein IKV00_04235, partial [Clostridia bacterium]|nr:hypothetical protein [Clostridia bacterium]